MMAEPFLGGCVEREITGAEPLQSNSCPGLINSVVFFFFFFF